VATHCPRMALRLGRSPRLGEPSPILIKTTLPQSLPVYGELVSTREGHARVDSLAYRLPWPSPKSPRPSVVGQRQSRQRSTAWIDLSCPMAGPGAGTAEQGCAHCSGPSQLRPHRSPAMAVGERGTKLVTRTYDLARSSTTLNRAKPLLEFA
jgi:hypothetical protein